VLQEAHARRESTHDLKAPWVAEQVEPRLRSNPRPLERKVVLAHELLEGVLARQRSTRIAHGVEAAGAVGALVENASID
jgi:hypothetical protein